MITYVLDAPGSGKSTASWPLAALLPNHAVLDWDAFMAPVAAVVMPDQAAGVPSSMRVLRLSRVP